MTNNLANPNLSVEDKAKYSFLITKHKQQLNTQKHLNIKSKFIEDIYSKYNKEMEQGKIPKFLNKSNIH